MLQKRSVQKQQGVQGRWLKHASAPQVGCDARLRDAVALAAAAGDLPSALKQLALVRLRFPGDPFGITEAAALLHRMDRHDDAETLLANGMKRAQLAADVAPAYARAAMLRARWPDAVLRWTRARTLRPDDPACTAGVIAALLLAGRDDAAALAAEAGASQPGWPAIRAGVQDAVQAVPAAAARWQVLVAAAPADAVPTPDTGMLLRQGYAAAAASDWAAAEGAWRELRGCAPLLPEGWVHGALALRRLGRADSAAALLALGLAQLPAHRSLLIGLGYNASESEDWEAALSAWAEVRAMAPDAADGWVHAATALERLGRNAEAETLMADAVRHLPADRAVFARQAYLAVHRADRVVALERWQRMAAMFEGDAEILKGIALAQPA
jgi:tetratricopeptide (TPR) repeat protein